MTSAKVARRRALTRSPPLAPSPGGRGWGEGAPQRRAADQAPAEQQREDAGVDQRLANVRLTHHEEVETGQGGGGINQHVQPLPAFGAEPLDHAGSRGGGERHEQHNASMPMVMNGRLTMSAQMCRQAKN